MLLHYKYSKEWIDKVVVIEILLNLHIEHCCNSLVVFKLKYLNLRNLNIFLLFKQPKTCQSRLIEFLKRFLIFSIYISKFFNWVKVNNEDPVNEWFIVKLDRLFKTFELILNLGIL